jgi:hypothetical protein
VLFDGPMVLVSEDKKTAETNENKDETRPQIVIVDEEKRMIEAFFIAQVGLSFVNIDIREPLLALTCQATLREKEGNTNTPARGLGIAGVEREEDVQELSISVSNPNGDPTYLIGSPEDERSREVVTIMKSQERDIFQGLTGGDRLPRSRLYPARNDEIKDSRKLDRNRQRSGTEAGRTTMVLRKSYRSILPILSVLTVRMRTLPTACLPPVSSSRNDDYPIDGDLAATICIEVEAGQLGNGVEFEVENVAVAAGRHGIEAGSLGTDDWGKAKVKLATPFSAADGESQDRFPFDIKMHDQYNLVYHVTASSSPSGIPLNGLPETAEVGGNWGTQTESIPLRIDVIGRVKNRKQESPDEMEFINVPFTSTWNTVIELRTSEKQNRTATFRPISNPNGTGRNSIESTVGGRTGSMRNVSSSARSTASLSGKQQNSPQIPLHRDLVVSAKIIREHDDNAYISSPTPDAGFQIDGTDDGERPVKCYEVFYLELTVLNASGRTVRLMVASGQSGRADGSNGEEKGARRLISGQKPIETCKSATPMNYKHFVSD